MRAVLMIMYRSRENIVSYLSLDNFPRIEWLLNFQRLPSHFSERRKLAIYTSDFSDDVNLESVLRFSSASSEDVEISVVYGENIAYTAPGFEKKPSRINLMAAYQTTPL
ncbi:MAG: hypothetical protein ACP5I3_10025 [Thermoproteus sp.]